MLFAAGFKWRLLTIVKSIKQKKAAKNRSSYLPSNQLVSFEKTSKRKLNRIIRKSFSDFFLGFGQYILHLPACGFNAWKDGPGEFGK